ncbi:hypothetical protein LBMAG57_17790 [Verrucomicrobiota bacterium]|nr:hypothetical protein LBMAG57_17790 [Verrucomicrobiota bacterium]
MATTPSPERIVRTKQPPAQGFRQKIGGTEIPAPRVDPQLVRLSVIERLAEVLLYTLRRA